MKMPGVTPPPAFPDSKLSAERSLIFEYREDQFHRMIDSILKIVDRNPNKLIGIFSPNNSVRKRYLDTLRNSEVQLDNRKPRIQTYQSGASSEISFNEGGVMVINARSCKGLEFDIVFLADINEYKCWQAILDEKKKLFYVMVARAMDRIIMLREKGKQCPVECFLPKRAEVLEWK